MVWAKTEIEVEELGEAAKRESSADQQDGGESDLANDQELAEKIGSFG